MCIMLAVAAVMILPGTANASTTHQFMHHADGNVAGEAWWNSGPHAEHTHGLPGYGFNAFTITDQFCGDGWGLGVVWVLDGVRREVRSEGDCAPREIRYATGQATREMRAFRWQIFMWNTNNPLEVVYAPDGREDWMASYARCTSPWLTESTFYNDHIQNRPTFTVSMTPTTLARLGGWGRVEEIQRNIEGCTPFLAHLTPTERVSMRQQLACHVYFGWHEELGGPTWEFESARRIVSEEELFGQILVHKCNW